VSNLSNTRRIAGSLATTNDGSVSDWMQCERTDVRRKRLLFRCWHRGTQEGDLIFGRFAEAYLADFDLAQLERFEALLDCTDPDLYDWIVVGIAPPEEYDHDVMSLLRAFAWQSQKRN
jgi:antitoxin CptB